MRPAIDSHAIEPNAFALRHRRGDRGVEAALYLPVYAQLFEPIRRLPLAMLELGIHQGGSMKAWEAYFPAARIAGVDIRLPAIEVGERVRMFAGDQTDCRLLTRVAAEMAPDGFDVIIDDCSHIGTLSKVSFWHLFENHLKPGGFYCIEDWGTGYLPTWPDGREWQVEPGHRRPYAEPRCRHGRIRQAIGRRAACSHVRARARRISKFASMTLHTGVCIITKAGEPNWPAAPEESTGSPGALHRLLRRLAGRRRRGGRRERGY